MVVKLKKMKTESTGRKTWNLEKLHEAKSSRLYRPTEKINQDVKDAALMTEDRDN